MKSSSPDAAAQGRPVNFFSIEIVTPAQSFWESLARLLVRLAEGARRRSSHAGTRPA